MDEKDHKISVSNDLFKKLERLALLLKVNIHNLVDLAFKDFFQYIKDDPTIFLENFGVLDELKEIIDEES